MYKMKRPPPIRGRPVNYSEVMQKKFEPRACKRETGVIYKGVGRGSKKGTPRLVRRNVPRLRTYCSTAGRSSDDKNADPFCFCLLSIL